MVEMHVFLYLVSIVIFSSRISGESKKAFAEGKFKGSEAELSVPGTSRQLLDLLIQYDKNTNSVTQYETWQQHCNLVIFR